MADGRAMKKMADTAGMSAAALPDRARTRDLDVGRLLLEGRAFFALIVIVAVFSLLSPYYFSVGNFLTMASHVAIYGILAVGMLLVILSGGIDLSVGSTLGLSGVVAGFLMQGVPSRPSASRSTRRCGWWPCSPACSAERSASSTAC